MRHILFTGEWPDCTALMKRLVKTGYYVSIQDENFSSPSEIDLLIVRAKQEDQFASLDVVNLPWIAWCSRSGEFSTRAYQAGALAVFPAEADAEVLFKFIERHFALNKGEKKSVPFLVGSIQRRYQKGDIIQLEPDSVLDVQRGIIAQTMVHQDGAEVLLGLFGPQNMVVPHPEDTCYIQLVAHTDVIVRIRPWQVMNTEPDFVDRLRCRLQQMEAWAAMQARPHLDQRVLGILSLLAEQFGEPDENGELVNVRITHMQLASAVGTTRATVTRTLGDLKTQGRLLIVTTTDGERFCLPRWEHGQHNLHAASEPKLNL